MIFPLVDRYVGMRLGTDLSAIPRGKVCVVESERRLRAELSYGYVHRHGPERRVRSLCPEYDPFGAAEHGSL